MVGRVRLTDCTERSLTEWFTSLPLAATSCLCPVAVLANGLAQRVLYFFFLGLSGGVGVRGGRNAILTSTPFAGNGGD